MFSAISDSGGGFEAKIHFDLDRARQSGDGFDRTQTLRFGRKILGGAGGEEEGVEIDVEAALDAGAQHLHGDGLAFAGGVDFGLVHLRDGGRGDRGSEAGVGFAERPVERSNDDSFRFALRKRRHAVLQAFQAVRDLRADDIRARRHELAEFDVSRSEFGERGGEAARAFLGGGALDQPRHRNKGAFRQRQRPRVDQREHAFARQHIAGAGQPYEMR